MWFDTGCRSACRDVLFNALKVRSDVRRIFDYRFQRIHELFAEQKPAGRH